MGKFDETLNNLEKKITDACNNAQLAAAINTMVYLAFDTYRTYIREEVDKIINAKTQEDIATKLTDFLEKAKQARDN